MTKILGVKDFMVSEGYTKLHKVTEDVLNLTSIKVRCTWDGEHWYYYDREKKGTLEEFKALPENNNTNLEIYVNYMFKINEESFKIDELVTVHFFNMAKNDYEVDWKYCHGMKEFASAVYEYDADEDYELLENIRELVETDFEDGKDTIANEIEDYVGIKDDEALLNDVYGEIIEGFMENFKVSK